MLKPIRTGTVVLGMGLAWCCGCCILATPDSYAQEPSKAGKCYVLSIQGMTCEDCAKHVQKALEKVDGIAEAKVNFTKAEAKVCLKPGATVTEDALLKVVEKAGYKAKVKSRD